MRNAAFIPEAEQGGGGVGGCQRRLVTVGVFGVGNDHFATTGAKTGSRERQQWLLNPEGNVDEEQSMCVVCKRPLKGG